MNDKKDIPLFATDLERQNWIDSIDRITEPQEWIDGLLKVYAPNSEDIDVALQNMGLRIRELEKLETIQHEAEFNIGKWLSAALDDNDVCAEMKLDIVNWFTFIGNKK
jgi:hypothetical protein